MLLLGDEVKVEARVGPIGDSANHKIGARFAPNIP
jgi:hypothetical protein